jgi:hypothetical protein
MLKTLTTLFALAISIVGAEMLFAQVNLPSANLAPTAFDTLEDQDSSDGLQEKKSDFGEPTSVQDAARPKPKCCKPAQMCCPAKHCCVAG